MFKWLWLYPLFLLSWCHVFSHIRHQCQSHRILLTSCTLSLIWSYTPARTKHENAFFFFGGNFEWCLMTSSFCFVLQSPEDPFQLLGFRIPPTPPSACCSQEGKESSCHSATNSAIKQKAQLVFESTFPTYTGFPSNWLLCLFHTLHFTWILFSNLVLLSPGPRVSWPVRMQSDWKLCILSHGKHPDFLF